MKFKAYIKYFQKFVLQIILYTINDVIFTINYAIIKKKNCIHSHSLVIENNLVEIVICQYTSMDKVKGQ